MTTRIATLAGLALGALVAGVAVIAYNSSYLATGRIVSGGAVLGIIAAGAFIGACAGYWAAGGFVLTPAGYEPPGLAERRGRTGS